MDTRELPNNYINKTITLVLLNDDLTFNTIPRGYMVYAAVTDKPLKQGIFKCDVGVTPNLIPRFKSHFFDNFGSDTTSQDYDMAFDLCDTIYIFLLKTGISSYEDALGMEAVYQTQYCLDVCEDAKRKRYIKYCTDLRLVLKYDNDISNLTYNRKIGKEDYVRNHRSKIEQKAYTFINDLVKRINDYNSKREIIKTIAV